MTSIYIITNKLSNKVYIGQTRRSVHTRFLEHRRETGSALYDDMNNLGINNFSVSILHVCEDCYADQWEHYYICKYDSTNCLIGYNKVSTRAYKFIKGGYNPSKTEEGRKRISKNNKNNLENITKGLRKYNNSRKFPVNMLDDSGNVIRTFDSLSDACKYLNKSLGGTTRIKNVCDVFNKNGKRAKFFGYSWSAVNKGVQTNSKVEDELPSE